MEGAIQFIVWNIRTTCNPLRLSYYNNNLRVRDLALEFMWIRCVKSLSLSLSRFRDRNFSFPSFFLSSTLFPIVPSKQVKKLFFKLFFYRIYIYIIPIWNSATHRTNPIPLRDNLARQTMIQNSQFFFLSLFFHRRLFHRGPYLLSKVRSRSSFAPCAN